MSTDLRPLRESEVSPSERQWAKSILADVASFPLGSVTTIAPGIVARVETHHVIGATNTPRPDGIRGVSLYRVGERSPAERAQGIDVSSFQPTVDWARVAASGVSFAYIKASEGVTVTDRTYSAHRDGARAAGLLVGAYHFFRVHAGPTQVDHFLDVLGGDVGELPPALDVEWQRTSDALDGVDPGAFAAEVQECLEQLAVRTGRRPVLYTAPGFWPLLPARPHVAALADLWCAKYGPEPGPLAPWPRWALWQYTDRRPVPGVGPDDASVFCGTVDELRAWASNGALPVAAPPAPPAPTIDPSTPRGLQLALNAAGASPPLDVDGDVGAKTRGAIRAFQAAHGLAVDGVPGPATLAALRSGAA